MAKEQSWETCKYAVAFDSRGEIGHELREHGLYEGYGCEHPKLLKLGIYPTDKIKERDGSFTRVAKFQGILIAPNKELSKEDVNELKRIVQEALRGCKHCKYYEQL